MSYNIEELKHAAITVVEKNKLPAITNQQDFATAGDILKLLKNQRAKIEAERKTYTDPLFATQKKIKAEFDRAGAPLDEAIAMIDLEMKTVWPKLKAAADAEQKRIDADAASTAGTDGVLVPIVNNLKTSQGDISSTTMRTKTKYRLIDSTLAPSELVVAVNDTTVEKWAEENKETPPGFEAYEDLILSSR